MVILRWGDKWGRTSDRDQSKVNIFSACHRHPHNHNHLSLISSQPSQLVTVIITTTTIVTPVTPVIIHLFWMLLGMEDVRKKLIASSHLMPRAMSEKYPLFLAELLIASGVLELEIIILWNLVTISNFSGCAPNILQSSLNSGKLFSGDLVFVKYLNNQLLNLKVRVTQGSSSMENVAPDSERNRSWIRCGNIQCRLNKHLKEGLARKEFKIKKVIKES